MVIGGNDGFNVDVAGKLYGPTTPEWQTEFARRIAVVMQTLSGNGKRPVYWVPPPTARDELYNRIYRSENEAAKRAADAVPGGRYVDIYTTINDGRYSDEEKIDGRRVLGAPVRRHPLQPRGSGPADAPYPQRDGEGLPRAEGGREPMRRATLCTVATLTALMLAALLARRASASALSKRAARQRRLARGRHRALHPGHARALERAADDGDQPPRARGPADPARLRPLAAARDRDEPRHQRRPALDRHLPAGGPRHAEHRRLAALRGLGEHRAAAGRRHQLRRLQPRARARSRGRATTCAS